MTIKKVLVIDDEILMRTTLKILLSNYGIETVLASNGNEGFVAAKKELPDIILLDIMLPDLNGWEVIKKLKEDPDTKHLPIVIFTAIDINVNKEELKESGVVSWIRKPFQLKQLLSILKIDEKGEKDE